MYVYDGSVWIAASAASEAILTVYRYTATAGQTTFTGADDNALTLSYTAGSAIITINGAVMEVGTDVTASNGSSIVLAQAALVGDEVNIYAFATFNVANTYTQAEADARFFNVTGDSISGNLTFTGTGNRILGDFTNATYANRLAIQTSTTNGATVIPIAPNGTATQTTLNLETDSALTNGSFLQLNSSAVFAAITAGIRGTGSYQPMVFNTGGSERLRIDTSGNVGIGTSSSTNKQTIQVSNTSTSANSESGLSIFNSARGNNYQATVKFGSYESNNTTRWTAGEIGAAFTAYTDGANSGALLFSTSNAGTVAERMRIDSSGNLLVGTTASAGKITSNTGAGNSAVTARHSGANGAAASYYSIYDNTTGTAYGAVFFYNGFANQPGQITYSSTTVSYTSNSDYRLKENIEPMTGALAKVSALKPVTYTWKSTGEESQGFIAHELQEVVPDCVTGEKDAVDKDGKPVYQGIDTSFLVATLTAAIQELSASHDALKATVDAQAARIAALEGTV